jgi:hypothetical protein
MLHSIQERSGGARNKSMMGWRCCMVKTAESQAEPAPRG